VEKRFGTVIAGLDEYEASPDLVSGSAAEEYVAGILKGKSRSRKWINEKPVQNIDTGEVFSSGYAAARALGLKNLDKIGNAIRGGYRCAGFRWKFAPTPSPTPEETHCSLVEA
jgi:hypothetical protein